MSYLTRVFLRFTFVLYKTVRGAVVVADLVVAARSRRSIWDEAAKQIREARYPQGHLDQKSQTG